MDMALSMNYACFDDFSTGDDDDDPREDDDEGSNQPPIDDASISANAEPANDANKQGLFRWMKDSVFIRKEKLMESAEQAYSRRQIEASERRLTALNLSTRRGSIWDVNEPEDEPNLAACAYYGEDNDSSSNLAIQQEKVAHAFAELNRIVAEENACTERRKMSVTDFALATEKKIALPPTEKKIAARPRPDLLSRVDSSRWIEHDNKQTYGGLRPTL